MRCILRFAIMMTFSISLLGLLSMAPSAADEEPEFPLSLSEGILTIPGTACQYLVTGCPEPGTNATLEICNTVSRGAVYHLSLCSESGKTSYFPNITVNGGKARELTIIVHIEGDVVIGDLLLSGYHSADIRIATSGGGKLTLGSIHAADDAKKTSFSPVEDTAITPGIPELSVISSGYTSATPVTFTLAVKETELCTIEFIIAGIPDRHIFVKIEKGEIPVNYIPPDPENDRARVFLGWSKLPNENISPDFSLPVENDMILYAYFHYHNYSVYSYNSDSHWKECECGQTSPDGKTPHELYADESPECLVAAADCTHPAVYRYSCSCGFHSDKTFESIYSPAKGHTEKTKGNEIICADCGIHIRDIQPIGGGDDSSDGDGRAPDDPPLPPNTGEDGQEDVPPDRGAGKNHDGGSDSPFHSESGNETGDSDLHPASYTHELPPIAAVSIIAGLLLAAVLTVVIAIHRYDR